MKIIGEVRESEERDSVKTELYLTVQRATCCKCHLEKTCVLTEVECNYLDYTNHCVSGPAICLDCAKKELEGS